MPNVVGSEIGCSAFYLAPTCSFWHTCKHAELLPRYRGTCPSRFGMWEARTRSVLCGVTTTKVPGGEITEDHWLCLCLKMEVSEQGQSFFFLSTFLVRICRFHHVAAAAAAAAAAGFAVVLLLQKFLQHTVLNVPLFNSVFVKSNMFDCNGSASKKHLRHQWTDLCRRQQRSWSQRVPN